MGGGLHTLLQSFANQAEAKRPEPCGIQDSSTAGIEGVQLFGVRSNLGGHHRLKRRFQEDVLPGRLLDGEGIGQFNTVPANAAGSSGRGEVSGRLSSGGWISTDPGITS